MKLVFFGSPDVAVPALTGLAAAGFDVAAVYTQPDRPSGRGRTEQPTPVKRAAAELGLPVRTPELWRDRATVAELASWSPDALVVAAYGKILRPDVLAVPRLGVVNIHPSLLPRYRGTSPVQTAILDGERQTGVTVMLLDAGMDTGPILAQSEQEAVRADDTGGSLMERLFEMGARLLVETLPRWAAGEINARPQREEDATVTRLLKRADGMLDWRQAADRLERQVRAFDPWPGTHTTWDGKNLKVLRASLVAGVKGEPGAVTIREASPVVASAGGGLRLDRVQLEGRRAVTGHEFVRGYPGFSGVRLPS